MKLSFKLLKKHRGKTDESLITERDKTDVSFLDSRTQTERVTDEKVQVARQEADETRAQSRVETDANIVLERESKYSLDKNKGHSELTSDNSLREQRKHHDAAVFSERKLMDQAMIFERKRNTLEMNSHLENERKETDKSLLQERMHTDSQAELSLEALTKEKSSHAAAKIALTTRDELLAIVSHDLRNPIGTVLSYAELLLDPSPRTNEDSRIWAEVISRNANSALRLISDILDVERFAEGKLNLKFAQHDLNDITSEAVQNHIHLALAKSIKLQAPAVAVSDSVNCDKERVEQILSNLIGNALKFTPEGGAITVTTQDLPNEVVISVEDTGSGILPDKKEHIFERFAQIGNTDRTGLGLGLFISKMLVESHKGKIWVTSIPNKGSKFHFTLPKISSS